MIFEKLLENEEDKIWEMSFMASTIVKEHFDPIVGAEQNDYMIKKFQTPEAIRKQIVDGYQYYFVSNEDECVGFLAFYPGEAAMYLSKFYLYKEERGKGYSRQMLDFVIEEAKKADCKSIELNVNKNNSACNAYEKLGFQVIRNEKNDIGNGFYMDDYVYAIDMKERVGKYNE